MFTTSQSSKAAPQKEDRWKALLYGLLGITSVAVGYTLLRRSGWASFTPPVAQPAYRDALAADENSVTVVINSIEDQLVGLNAPFSFSLNSRDIFEDPDGDVLTITVEGVDEESLPEWLRTEVVREIKLLGSYDTPSFAYGVVLIGSTAYVADGATGLQIIDVSNSASPTLLGSYDTPGTAYSVVISGSTAYVADYGIMFRVIPFSGNLKMDANLSQMKTNERCSRMGHGAKSC